jgi:small GTP-binding protein
MSGSTINPNILPIDNINIAIIGCVSAGKSTILNALFCEDYAQSKIKRTTMMPTIFVETHNVREIQSQEEISQRIESVNKTIIEHTESGRQFKLQDYGDQLVFKVKKLENVQFSNKFNVNIWDTPGLNDARTKSVYYDYLKRNFHNLNVIIFVVDILNGLNTSDEIDILEFIASNIAEHKRKSGKNISLITVVNKSDDMQIKNDGSLEIVSEELNEMFEQVKYTVSEKFKKHNISKNLEVMPICSRDAHIYRIIKKYGNQYNLTEEVILRIGTNEQGKNFSRKNAQTRRQIVQEIIQNEDFVDSMIELSGFEQMTKKVTKFVGEQDSRIVGENLEFIHTRTAPVNLTNLISTIKGQLGIICKYERFDQSTFNQKMKTLIKEINTLIYVEISKINTVDSVINYYNNILSTIKSDEQVSTVCKRFWDFSVYPAYIKEKIIEIINGEFTDHTVSIRKLEYFNHLDSMNALTIELVEILLNALMKNVRGVATFIFDDKSYMDGKKLFKIFSKIKRAPNFIKFIRFMLINMLSDKQINNNEMILYKSMYFKKMKEIPISSYINNVLIKSIDTSKYLDTYLTGINQDEQINEQSMIFESYYMNLIKESDSVNII